MQEERQLVLKESVSSKMLNLIGIIVDLSRQLDNYILLVSISVIAVCHFGQKSNNVLDKY